MQQQARPMGVWSLEFGALPESTVGGDATACRSDIEDVKACRCGRGHQQRTNSSQVPQSGIHL
jgi:hypothetical protein